MKVLITSVFVLALTSPVLGAMGDIAEISKNGDTFDVVCNDGSYENVTSAQLASNHVCLKEDQNIWVDPITGKKFRLMEEIMTAYGAENYCSTLGGTWHFPTLEEYNYIDTKFRLFSSANPFYERIPEATISAPQSNDWNAWQNGRLEFNPDVTGKLAWGAKMDPPSGIDRTQTQFFTYAGNVVNREWSWSCFGVCSGYAWSPTHRLAVICAE